ncbi:ABC transporter I family member 19 [Vitis vinifera]|uniref:ABC transporter I family member 19 n=1 Tax=Vitis vinifera TaxID=29760 RepID=A0A438KDV0_VITVI|nr:ABC transporter I family member 19 [Vitis vinifera]
MTDDKTFDIVSPEVGAVTKMAIQSSSSSNSIKVNGLQFAYEGQPPLFLDFNLQISPGSRCLLVGANGSGYTRIQLQDDVVLASLQLLLVSCRENHFAEDFGREAHGWRERCGAGVELFGFSRHPSGL